MTTVNKKADKKCGRSLNVKVIIVDIKKDSLIGMWTCNSETLFVYITRLRAKITCELQTCSFVTNADDRCEKSKRRFTLCSITDAF